jgi:predicted nucleic acid-binding protein
MPEYFVDTWFFVARLNRFDAHHRVAQRLEARYRGDLVTHDGVLTEVLAFFSGLGQTARIEAAQIVRRTIRETTVIELDRRLFLTALDLYEDRNDKEYSLVDCMSMSIMLRRGITHAITNDHHFAQEGFTLLNA